MSLGRCKDKDKDLRFVNSDNYGESWSPALWCLLYWCQVSSVWSSIGNQGRGAGTSSQIKHHKMFMIADAHDHYILPQLPLSARSPGHFSLLPMLPHFCIPVILSLLVVARKLFQIVIQLQKTKACDPCSMTMCVYCIVQCLVLHWLCVFPASNTCCAVALPSISRVLTLDLLTSQGMLFAETREQ